MSMGTQNNGNYNNNEKKKNHPEVYSAYKMSNMESTIDQTQFSAKFWNSMIVLSIAPKLASGQGFDHENNISIFLSHTKARMLADEIAIFLQDPNRFENVGVNSSKGLISISNGKQYGVNCPVISISLIDDSGNATVSYGYQVKEDHHYSIRNFDSSTPGAFDKVFYNSIELEQLETLLRSYYESMTGAFAYSVIDQMKYDASRTKTKLDLIAEKLGVEFQKGGSYTKKTQSAFDKTEGRNTSYSRSTSLEDAYN